MKAHGVDEAIEITKISKTKGKFVDPQIDAGAGSKGSSDRGLVEISILKVIAPQSGKEEGLDDPEGGLNSKISAHSHYGDIKAGDIGIEGISSAVKSELKPQEFAGHAHSEVKFTAGQGGIGDLMGRKTTEADPQGQVGVSFDPRLGWFGFGRLIVSMSGGVVMVMDRGSRGGVDMGAGSGRRATGSGGAPGCGLSGLACGAPGGGASAGAGVLLDRSRISGRSGRTGGAGGARSRS